MLVYHATTARNAGHIKTEGLKINQPGNWDDIRTNDCIFFAFSAEVAIDYVETSDTYDDSKIVVFSVDTSDLDMDSIGYDWNNRCEELNDINSFAYYEEVPSGVLHKMTEDEIDEAEMTEFSDLPYLDADARDIYDALSDTFMYEVETNRGI